MLEEAMTLYSNLGIDKNIIETILNFDFFNKVETLSNVDLSKYCLVLSQYLIYFKYNYNKAHEQHVRTKKLIDDTVFQLLTDDILKKYKTKTDARSYLVSEVVQLKELQEKADSLDYEMILADGLDKFIQELINVIKKELARRENEILAARYERK